MAYDRYEDRRGWREQRSRSDNRGWDRGSDRDDDRQDRGFFERAGDEIASWFGDDDSDRRRREEMRDRGDEDSYRRNRSFTGEGESSRFGQQPRYRDEGYRRPYTGRFTGRQPARDDDRFERGSERGSMSERGWSERWDSPSRQFTGTAGGMASGGMHDPHYSEWRRRQLDALDRDYDEYRRENQSKFESDFSNWRTTRQSKRQMLSQIRENMTVVGSDDEQVGTVDRVRGDRIVLTKADSEDGRHHMLSCGQIDRVEGDKVILDQPAAEAKRRFHNEDRGFFRDDQDEDRGPHILNRAFSGTYER